ncbi:MAG: FAD-binding protein [Gammaproteobacteria bacterium]|nr:FAD-binding protein [Gammaproteobacteria bacterium]
MSNILVIAEHANGQLNNSTARAVACAKAIGGEVTVLALTASGDEVATAAATIAGVSNVINLQDVSNGHALAATQAPQIAAIADGYSHVLAPNSTFGKDLMPRVAALMDAPMVTDIMAVHDARTFDRPVYAGNAITTVKVPDSVAVVATVRCASWAPEAGEQAAAAVESSANSAALPTHTRFVGLVSEQGDRPDLQAADRVVSGGRGLGAAEHFALVEGLADKLGAAVGASRAAVDSGWVPNDLQVGQTGKIIAPELYIAAGISGAIQHLAGIKDAGTIVAINKDPDAPIFEVADIGLVADLHQVLPELTNAL